MERGATYLHTVGVLDGLRRAVVDAHRALGESVLLLHLAVHEVERLRELGRAVLESLLEEVPSSLDLVTALLDAHQWLRWVKEREGRTYRLMNLER